MAKNMEIRTSTTTEATSPTSHSQTLQSNQKKIRMNTMTVAISPIHLSLNQSIHPRSRSTRLLQNQNIHLQSQNHLSQSILSQSILSQNHPSQNLSIPSQSLRNQSIHLQSQNHPSQSILSQNLQNQSIPSQSLQNQSIPNQSLRNQSIHLQSRSIPSQNPPSQNPPSQSTQLLPSPNIHPQSPNIQFLLSHNLSIPLLPSRSPSTRLQSPSTPLLLSRSPNTQPLSRRRRRMISHIQHHSQSPSRKPINTVTTLSGRRSASSVRAVRSWSRVTSIKHYYDQEHERRIVGAVRMSRVRLRGLR